MTDKVQVEIKGDVATIMLNKPERLNALDNEMWHGIGEACRAVDAAPDVRVAVLMGAGGCFCAGLIGKAKELIYSARRFDAAEALRIGLVQAVHPAGELGARVAELAAEIAANAPLAVQAAKRAINGTYYGEMRSWLDWETAQASGPLLSDDRKAGLKAAAERKRADFKGK